MHRSTLLRTSLTKRLALVIFTAAVSAALFPGAARGQSLQQGPGSLGSSSLDYSTLLSADAGGTAGPSPQYGRYPRRQQPYPYHGYQSHLAIEAGGGFNAPVNGTEAVQTWGWNATAGVGYKFAPDLSLMAEYQFIRSGITDPVLAAVGEPGGNVHTWSLTLDPVLYYKTTGTWGGYITGGGGFYRKLTSFTQPVTAVGQYCDFFFCYPYYYTEDVVVSHYSSNQGGVNIGTGLTFGGWNSAKFYTEARYTWINTPGHPTEMVPVTLGVRW